MEILGVEVGEWIELGGWVAATVYLVYKGIPKMIQYIDAKYTQKETALKEERDRAERLLSGKDDDIKQLIKDHEERNDRKDKALEILTNQLLKESEQNRLIAEKCISAIAEVRTDLVPLRDLNNQLSRQVDIMTTLITKIEAL